MYKVKIQNHKDKVKRTIGIAISIFIVLLMILLIILRITSLKIEEKNVSYENLKTVQDVLNFYKCKYIGESKSTEDGYEKDIKLQFRYKLYDGETSNETFFNGIIKDMTRILEYTNFRMIDTENDIEIKVKCENRKIIQILINGVEDYFIYMNSLIDLGKYEEIPITEFQVESLEINTLLSNNWSSQTSFGTRDSIFNEYHEFFEEGIKTRTISGKIYNIVFTNKYQKSVVNGIYPGMTLDLIESKLGKPSFENTELNVIGYKSKNLYVFFGKDEISIYRNEKVNCDDFFILVDKLINDKLDLLEFMNELTYLWPDYSEYKYDSSHVFISYPLKGVDIQIGHEDVTDGIQVYNNINEDRDLLRKYFENTEFISRMKLDNVFEAEQRRIKNNNSLKTNCEEFFNKKTDKEKSVIGKSNEFDIFTENDDNNKILSMKFISKTGNYPNREINDLIDSFVWINDYIMIYTQAGKGMFYIDLRTGERNLLLEGENNFKIKNYENGILKYDDEEVTIQF